MLTMKQPVRIINDLTSSPDDRLGAIGDINFAFQKEGYTDDFLVLGGDNIFKGSLRYFLHFSKNNKPFVSVGLFDIKKKKEACRYGVVSLNKSSQIVDFCEKPEKPKSSLVAMCLYYFPKS